MYVYCGCIEEDISWVSIIPCRNKNICDSRHEKMKRSLEA